MYNSDNGLTKQRKDRHQNKYLNYLDIYVKATPLYDSAQLTYVNIYQNN